MKAKLPSKLEAGRVTTGPMRSNASYGTYGHFRVMGPCGSHLFIVSAGGIESDAGWEHVSVSVEGRKRTPNWPEMCFVKDLLWEPEECVVQYHPPQSVYINSNLYVLHLWRPLRVEMPMPPTWMV